MEQAKTRKPHKKSRNGCLPCKARHVKCDEQKPDCVNCDKYGSKCEYPQPRKRIASSDTASPHAVVSTPSSTEATQQPAPAPSLDAAENLVLSIPQLRLLHHFTTVTAHTLVVETEAGRIFSSLMVQTAFEYPFLLHAILALSALHLSCLESSLKESHLHQAEKYHGAALGQFRAHVTDIDESNFRAVLFFAATLFPYFCAFPISMKDGMDHAFDTIFSNLMLTRRIRPMVSRVYQEMISSDLIHVIPSDTRKFQLKDHEVPPETELVALRRFSEVIHHLYPTDIIEAYTNAIHILELLFAAVAQSPQPPSDSLVKLWIHFVTDRFMELLSGKQPGALVIFAHWAVLLSKCQGYWFLAGVSEQILDVIESLVPSEWKNWLDWPKVQIRP